MRITLKDIAKKAGVSPTTVSLVLNNKPCRVSEKTRSEIISIANNLNYIPNHQARSLASNKSFIVGLLVPNIENPFFAKLSRLIEKSLLSEGYMTLIMNSNDDPSYENRLLTKLIGMNIDALVCVVSNPDNFKYDELFNLTNKSNTEIILIDRYNLETSHNQIYFDNIKGGYLATTYLIANGHKNIATIMATEKKFNSHKRFLGYKQALEENNITLNESIQFECDFDFYSGYKIALELIKDKDITAAFCANDLIALGILRKLQEIGVRVPDDFSIIGYDNIVINDYFTKKLTTIEQDVSKLAKITVRKVLENLNKKRHNELIIFDNIILNPLLIEGETTSNINE